MDNTISPKYIHLIGDEVSYHLLTKLFKNNFKYNNYFKAQYFQIMNGNIYFNEKRIDLTEVKENFATDIKVTFKGPDNTYYFIRNDYYCRRELNGSQLYLDPPDYV